MNNQKQSRGFYHAEPKLELSELTSCLKTNLFFSKLGVSLSAGGISEKKKKKQPKNPHQEKPHQYLLWNILKTLLWHYQHIPFHFFYPKLLLVEFNVIFFSRSSFFFQKLHCSDSRGKFTWLQHSTPSWSLESWHYDFKSSVCANEELAIGNKPTAVHCQY